MFKAERLQKIKSLVYDRKQVDVASLSTQLNVTEVTIRSDLEQLEKEGYLKRLHGGAVLNENYSSQQEINDLLSGQVIAYSAEKERVAKRAAQLIEEGECIFLGPGETCYYIAKELVHFKRLTILTNNLYVANILSSNMHLDLTLTGGQLVQGRYCVAEDKFRAITEDLFLTKSFFSAAGVDMLAGYTLATSQEAAVYREIAGRSRENILAVDHTKFDTISFVKLGNLDLFPSVVTDVAPPQPYSEQYLQHSISVLTPD